MANRPDLKAIRDASPGAAMLERLRKGTENERICQWPGTEDEDGKFRLVPLTCTELQDAYAAAFARFEELKLPMNLWTADDFNSEVNHQVIARAMRTMDDRDARMFGDANELRDLISPDERTAITTEYLRVMGEADPDPADMNPDTLAKIEDLVKKKDVLQLSAFPSPMLAAYIIGTAGPSES